MVDYVYSDYKCLALDCLGSCCDARAITVAFFPKTRITTTTTVFDGCTAGSKFAQTLQDKYKKAGGLPGCG